MNENISGSEFTQFHAAPQPTPEGPRRQHRKPNRRRRPGLGPKPGPGTKEGHRIPLSGIVGGMLPDKLLKSGRPSCGGSVTQTCQSVSLPKSGVTVEKVLTPPDPTLGSGDLDVSGVVPDQLTEAGGARKWECSLTPRVLRAHNGMDLLARRRFLKLLGDFAPKIRNARSHEEREMIMDRLAMAAVTFKKERCCVAVPVRGGTRRKKPKLQVRRTCRRWAATQIAFGSRDLPSSSTRRKVREAYLKFVEKNGFPPGHNALMSLTGLSAKRVLGVLAGIEEDLGFTRSSGLHELTQVPAPGVRDQVSIMDLIEKVQEILAGVAVHDQILWVLRFGLDYRPKGILQRVAELRATASAEAIVTDIEQLATGWPKLTEACRELKHQHALMKLTTSGQIRCRLFRLNRLVKDRLKALGYRA